MKCRAVAAGAIALALIGGACGDDEPSAVGSSPTTAGSTGAAVGGAGGGASTGGTAMSGGELCERMADVAAQLFEPGFTAEFPPDSPGPACDWTTAGIGGGSVTFSGQLFDAGAAGFGRATEMLELYREDPVFGTHVGELDLGDAAIRTFDPERPEAGEQAFVASGGLLAIVLAPGGGEGTGRSLAVAALAAFGEDVEGELVPFVPAQPGEPCSMLTAEELGSFAAIDLAIGQESDRYCGYDVDDDLFASLDRQGNATSLADPRRSISDFTTALVEPAYISRARSDRVVERVIVRFVASDGFVYDLTFPRDRSGVSDTVDYTDEELLELVAGI